MTTKLLQISSWLVVGLIGFSSQADVRIAWDTPAAPPLSPQVTHQIRVWRDGSTYTNNFVTITNGQTLSLSDGVWLAGLKAVWESGQESEVVQFAITNVNVSLVRLVVLWTAGAPNSPKSSWVPVTNLLVPLPTNSQGNWALRVESTAPVAIADRRTTATKARTIQPPPTP